MATRAHLVALKVLARDDRDRPQDWDDLRAKVMLPVACARLAVQFTTVRGVSVHGVDDSETIPEPRPETLSRFR